MNREKIQIKAVLDKDIFLGCFLFVFFMMMFYESYKIVSLTVSDVGGDFFPKIVSVFGCIVSVFILLGGIQSARKKKNSPQIKKTSCELADEKNRKRKNSLVSMVSLGLILFYMVFFQILGFILSSSLYVLIQTFILTPDGKKRNIKNAAVILCVAGFIPSMVFFFFRYFFNLMLPVGLVFY
jgi:hypothetical protein